MLLVSLLVTPKVTTKDDAWHRKTKSSSLFRSWAWRRLGLHLPNGSVWFAPICGDPGSDENAQELSPDFAFICFIRESTFGWGAGMREAEKQIVEQV